MLASSPSDCDTVEGLFGLFSLRDQEKSEVDLPVIRDDAPLLPVKVKMANRRPSPDLAVFATTLPCRLGL